MSEHNEHTTSKPSAIQCLEILISGDVLQSTHDLRRILSVYSLENHPVRNHAISDFEIFHFMVFDWKRTIEKLLDDHKAPYSVTRYFILKSIYGNLLNREDEPDKTELTGAIHASHGHAAVDFLETRELPAALRVLEEDTHPV